MRVGVPSEVKQQEYRVAITPAGVQELVRNGHTVVIQAGAGRGSSLTDEEFEAAGASILPTAEAVWGSADMIVKVKEPLPSEYGFLREDLLLFTYLHLAASRECTEALLNAKTTSIAYETVELPDRTLPLLAPMSEVAGRLAPQVGAQALLKASGGRGVLLRGTPGVHAGKVVVIGAGVAGQNAAAIALGMQAEVLRGDGLDGGGQQRHGGGGGAGHDGVDGQALDAHGGLCLSAVRAIACCRLGMRRWRRAHAPLEGGRGHRPGVEITQGDVHQPHEPLEQRRDEFAKGHQVVFVVAVGRLR